MAWLLKTRASQNVRHHLNTWDGGKRDRPAVLSHFFVALNTTSWESVSSILVAYEVKCFFSWWRIFLLQYHKRPLGTIVSMPCLVHIILLCWLFDEHEQLNRAVYLKTFYLLLLNAVQQAAEITLIKTDWHVMCTLFVNSTLIHSL